MSTHEWFRENVTAFVAGGLDHDERDSFRDHLTRCADCRATVAEVERHLAWLPMGVTPVAPRPGFYHAALARVSGRGDSAWRRWGYPAALAASLLLAMGLAVDARQSRGALALADRHLTAIRDTLSIVREAGRVVQARIDMQQYQGGLVIFDDPRTHRWNVVVHGLPAAPAGERYQLWFITDDGMVSAATLHMDQTRPAFVTLEMPKQARRVLGAALTMEADHSDDGTPRGMELAHLML